MKPRPDLRQVASEYTATYTSLPVPRPTLQYHLQDWLVRWESRHGQLTKQDWRDLMAEVRMALRRHDIHL